MTLTHSSRINPTLTPGRGRASRLRLALRKPSLMHASRSSPAAAASARTDPPGPKIAAFIERHHHTTSCYHTPILYQLYHTPILYSTAMHCTVATRTPFPCQACSVQPSTQHDTSRVVCRNAACNRRASSGVPKGSLGPLRHTLHRQQTRVIVHALQMSHRRANLGPKLIHASSSSF